MKKTYVFFGVIFSLFFGAPQSQAALSQCNVSQNLVVNCGFETADFSAWTVSGLDVPRSLGVLYGVEGTDPLDGIMPNSGTSQAFFASLDSRPITLSQTIATTPGTTYTIAWFLAQDTPVDVTHSNEFSASFGSTTLTNLTSVPVQNYTMFTESVMATTSSTLLSFNFGNDLGQFLIDDIGVFSPMTMGPAGSSTPEPSTWILTLAGALTCILLRKLPKNAK